MSGTNTARTARIVLTLALASAACTGATETSPSTLAISAAAASSSPASTASTAPTASPRPLPVVPAGFSVSKGQRADVIAEADVPPAAIERVQRAADASTERVERDFDRAFSYRPTLYLYRDEDSFRRALVDFWYYSAASADVVAQRQGQAIGNWTVLLNWRIIESDGRMFGVAHELTHAMVNQFDPGRRVPPWLNEGLARLEELTLDGMAWRAAEVRYVTASMAQTNTLLPFAGLMDSNFQRTTDRTWGSAAYDQSAQAAQFVIDEVGRDGILRILSLITQGASFPIAYLTVTGKKDYDFERGFAERARALGPVPATVLSLDDPRGPVLLVYGLPPSTKTSTSLRGANGSFSFQGTSTVYGTSLVGLGKLPAGQYTAMTTSGAVTVTATIQVVR